MCGEHRAIDRAKWLVKNQGKVMQEAKLQVMREFPAAFDGAGAEEEGLVHYLRVAKTGSTSLFDMFETARRQQPEACARHWENPFP